MINQDDIFDYIWHYPDGSSEGNETGVLIEHNGDKHGYGKCAFNVGRCVVVFR